MRASSGKCFGAGVSKSGLSRMGILNGLDEPFFRLTTVKCHENHKMEEFLGRN